MSDYIPYVQLLLFCFYIYQPKVQSESGVFYNFDSVDGKKNRLGTALVSSIGNVCSCISSHGS